MEAILTYERGYYFDIIHALASLNGIRKNHFQLNFERNPQRSAFPSVCVKLLAGASDKPMVRQLDKCQIYGISGGYFV